MGNVIIIINKILVKSIFNLKSSINDEKEIFKKNLRYELHKILLNKHQQIY
jgi:hypothetical protein